jgi:site-specific recombinase XerD
MQLSDAITAFLDHRQRADVSPKTLDVYTQRLRAWLAWHLEDGRPADLGAVSAADIRAYMDSLKQRSRYETSDYHAAAGRVGGPLSANTLASVWRTLRAMWNFCACEGWLTPDQATYFTRGRIPAPRIPQTARATYDDDSFEALLKACQSEVHEQHWRDRAILLMLRESGLRVEELCTLTDDQVELAQRRARIVGKGRKVGHIFWGKRTDAALKAYLHHRRGAAGGPLFRGLGSRNNGNAITPVAVRRLFRRLAQRAGVELPKGAPVHALRHTFAHECLDDGLDISQVSQLLRHSNIETTMRYVQEESDGLQELHRRVI